MPDPRPDRLVQVRRNGGVPVRPVRDVPRIDVFAWAPTEVEASSLGEQVRALFYAAAGTSALGVFCYRVTEFMGPRMDDDEATGTTRVWMTFEVSVRDDVVIHSQPSPGSAG